MSEPSTFEITFYVILEQFKFNEFYFLGHWLIFSLAKEGLLRYAMHLFLTVTRSDDKTWLNFNHVRISRITLKWIVNTCLNWISLLGWPNSHFRTPTTWNWRNLEASDFFFFKFSWTLNDELCRLPLLRTHFPAVNPLLSDNHAHCRWCNFFRTLPPAYKVLFRLLHI